MDLKLTVRRPGGVDATDVIVTCDATAQAGAVAHAIAERDPRRSFKGDPRSFTIRVDGPSPARVIAQDVPLSESGVRSGDWISLVPSSGRYADGSDGRKAVATLSIFAGPGAGKRFNLSLGSSLIGRDRAAEVQLVDPLASKRHARINVGEQIEIFDMGSVNGVEVDGMLTSRSLLRPGDLFTIGDTVLRVDHHQPTSSTTEQGTIAFNRSPYLNPVYEGNKVEAPEVPEPVERQPFPLFMMLTMIFMALVMVIAMSAQGGGGQGFMLIFYLMMPLMMLGSWFPARRQAKKQEEAARQNFRSALGRLSTRLDLDRAEEVAMRRREHLSVREAVQGAGGRANLLWAMRPDRHGYLDVRLGLAALPSRSEVEMPKLQKAIPELYDELVAVVQSHVKVSPVPVIAPLTKIGALGVAGRRDDALGAARALLVQIAGLHSPAEVRIAAVLPGALAPEWDWLKWLPHTSSAESPLEGGLLAAGAASSGRLVSELHSLIEDRLAQEDADREGIYPGTSIIVLVDDAAPVDRPALVALAENGRRAGVYVIWVADTMLNLPAACEIFFTHDPAQHTVATGIIEDGSTIVPMEGEPLDREAAVGFARDLCPVVDASAASDEASDVPARVSFLSEVGLELADSAASIVDRWRQSDSLPPDPAEVGRRRKKHNLTAYIGGAAHGPLTLDLRGQGPHALVGGTTGAGKSEFLQSWVMGLATMHSPARVTFLFVDYKGGAAFSECVRLPHSVGLVTDLSMHLVHRALRSLNAELRHREHILNAKKAKDVLELESRGDPDCPPSLVIIVDEFAALVAEVPEFVDGVVNVAQRGRSLGLHLILATQRPAGVIKDNLRANTNLRVALRMADEDDSTDVIGTKLAATFDPGIPGRGVAKTGPGRLQLFQSAYVGGWTTAEPPPPPITVADLSIGSQAEWEVPEEVVAARAAAEKSSEDQGPTDLKRLVDSTVAAAKSAAIPDPRKPWLPELAPVYDLAKTPQSRTDVELIYGVADDPDNQQQVSIAFRPDTDGNMCVAGTGGSGKSAFLRTLAVTAGLSTRGGPCHVYGLDFGSRGLAMLEPLPHVGSIINSDDDERIRRLIRELRSTIDERAERYAKVRAGSIADYRKLTGEHDEPRILVLLDGLPAFRQAYEVGADWQVFDDFVAIAGDGRQVGVHVVISTDRPNAIPSALASVIQRRLTLRMASEDDYASAGVPLGALSASSPPGRGFQDDAELQVAILGGSPSVAHQARAITALAEELTSSSGRTPAPGIGSLPEYVELESLPIRDAEGNPTVGVWDATLAAIGVTLDDPLLITGPRGSGRTTALSTVAWAMHRDDPMRPLVYICGKNAPLVGDPCWSQVLDMSTPDAGDTLDRWVEKLEADEGTQRFGFFIDNIAQFADGDSEMLLEQLIQSAARAGHAVVAESETDAASGYSDMLKAVRASRHGIALTPEEGDGDTIYRTTIPVRRNVMFPAGRGYYVRRGQASLIQVARRGDA